MVIALMVIAAAFTWLIKVIFSKCFGKKDEAVISYEEEWYGRGSRPNKGSGDSESDTAIKPYKIQVSDVALSDLKHRLENTRFEESLEESSFEYGFHSNYLNEVVNYWKNQYDWRKQEEYLNQYSHFKTRIEGIDVHFVHVKPTVSEGKKVIPILLIHGWPGSFLEFYKMIPMITSANDNHNFVFEVICPSIPGYGFSEAPHHKGFNQRAAARIFVTLMTRLGHSKFYVQGGDWGSFITTLIAKLYPTKVFGAHVNMFNLKPDLWNSLKYFLVYLFPSLVTPQEYSGIFPLGKKLKMILQETGYFHIQATKPDTVGCGLADSPVGLAAYILEKFSTWTDPENRSLPDGGLTKKFTLDELLTNVMIYWVNNNIKSSVKFYKEYVSDGNNSSYERMCITVPFGVAIFPNELVATPKMMASKKLIKDLVSYTVMPRGGHFAAMEEPQLLADDIWKFVTLTEKKSR